MKKVILFLFLAMPPLYTCERSDKKTDCIVTFKLSEKTPLYLSDWNNETNNYYGITSQLNDLFFEYESTISLDTNNNNLDLPIFIPYQILKNIKNNAIPLATVKRVLLKPTDQDLQNVIFGLLAKAKKNPNYYEWEGDKLLENRILKIDENNPEKILHGPKGFDFSILDKKELN